MPCMLNEVSVSGLYVPPLFLYLCLAMPLYLLLERLAWRWLECAWHPGLLRFFLSFIVLSVLVLKF
ncbi:DUF1656 domain-containing protein [Pseudomonas aeruginosa]|uniref:DUF1656 domain-containing protein n=1 Tax=Pseudomonas aeruginosa TaxID=287 RepID=UPI000E6A8BB6|nr:DUF1656 domain-containing protein [Pseudomonas aeruginosa]